MVPDGDVGVVVFIEAVRDVAGHHVFSDLIDQRAFEERHQVHLDHTHHTNPVGLASVPEQLLAVPYPLLGNLLKGRCLDDLSASDLAFQLVVEILREPTAFIKVSSPSGLDHVSFGVGNLDAHGPLRPCLVVVALVHDDPTITTEVDVVIVMLMI